MGSEEPNNLSEQVNIFFVKTKTWGWSKNFAAREQKSFRNILCDFTRFKKFGFGGGRFEHFG